MPTLWVHAGTHKTATSTLQALLDANRDALALRGLCYPRAGRAALPGGGVYPGHFNLVAELRGIARYDPALGGIDDAVTEIAASRCAAGCVSAEGFSTLYALPERLAHLRDRIQDAGFTARVLIYVRSQAEYLESLYAQLLQRGETARFEQFVDRAIALGVVSAIAPAGHEVLYPIEFSLALEVFARVFGRQNLVVRAFAGGRGRDWIVRDFFRTLGIEPGEELYARIPVLNERATTGDALRMLRENVRARTAPGGGTTVPETTAAIAAAPFRPLRTADAVRIARRFAADDARIRRTYGARVAPVTWRRLRGAISADLGFDPVARAARRALDRAAAGTAAP